MPTAHLHDRGVVRVSGADAKTFLDGLITCDVDKVAPGAARLGGLLTPQGKILFDFILFEGSGAEDGYWFDVARPSAGDLAKRLGFYKLRAKVVVEDRSETHAVVAGWDTPAPAGALVAQDPRLPALGWRAIVPAADAAPFSSPEGETAYHSHRIGLGIPEGGKDFAFGDAFPHEAMMDQLAGVDFDKGCYVGQEVVSRMQHRGTARTRIVPVTYPEGESGEPGAEVTAGEKTLGTIGSVSGGRALAMIRLDRAQDALKAGEPILAGGRPVSLAKPDWVRFEFPA